MKESTLEAIGYICQDIVSACLANLIIYSWFLLAVTCVLGFFFKSQRKPSCCHVLKMGLLC
jgi:hypothetical protein